MSITRHSPTHYQAFRCWIYAGHRAVLASYLVLLSVCVRERVAETTPTMFKDRMAHVCEGIHPWF